MFKYLRNLRHKESVKDLVLWNKIGAFYRYVIGVLPFNFSVNQFVTKILNSSFTQGLLSVILKIGVINIMIFSYLLKVIRGFKMFF